MDAKSVSNRDAGSIGIALLRSLLTVAFLTLALAASGAEGVAGETATAETGKSSGPDVVALRSQLGIIYAQQGNLTQARQEFVRLLEMPKGRAAALTNLGNLAFLEGQLDEAVASYEQAHALDQKDAGILLDLGLALKVRGDTERADKIFAQAVEMAGGVEQAAFLLGLPTGDDTSRGKVSKMTADEMRQMLAKAQAQAPTSGAVAKKPADKPEVASRPGGARAGVEAAGLYWKDE
jgi:Flp pilus assembly protein TadD